MNILLPSLTQFGTSLIATAQQSIHHAILITGALAGLGLFFAFIRLAVKGSSAEGPIKATIAAVCLALAYLVLWHTGPELAVLQSFVRLPLL